MESKSRYINKIKSIFPQYFNKNTLLNVIYFSGGTLLFIIGVILYGIIINIREIPLEEAMRLKGFTKLNNTSILIERKNYSLSLYEDTVLIKTYRANFGRNIISPKCRKGDNATPVGEYNICSIDTTNKYHKFLRLNYPNITDAGEALKKGIITQKQYDQLSFEFYYSDCPDTMTELGGDIGIQGIGEYNIIFKNLPFVYNWTDGSISVSNEDIDEIYSIVKRGTKVVIK
ncbi:MAG: L,D-transpeptidase [Ignavibacteriaceae bacterium]|nr:L,D-transpeptidase [Ignavibacteriaceae bacterium]